MPEPVADLSIGAPGPVEVAEGAATVDDEPAGDELQGDELAGAVVDLTPAITEAQVRAFLEAAGGVANQLGRDELYAPDVWRLTKSELDNLTPPLTRIINRRPALKRAVERGDEAFVALLLAQYAGRNFDTTRNATKARKAATAAARNPHLEADDGDGEREAGPAENGAHAGAGGDGGGWRPGGAYGGGSHAPDARP